MGFKSRKRTKTGSIVAVQLCSRNIGVHTLIKECKLSEPVSVKWQWCPLMWDWDPIWVDEQKLLDILPDGFLPTDSQNILLTIEDKNRRAGTAMRYPERFHDWGKYFKAYSLSLIRK